MKECLLAALLLAATSVSWAQQGVTPLQCDGTVSDFVQNIRDVENKGAYVEIRKNEVKVVAIAYFSSSGGTTYRISREDEAIVGFVLPTDDLYYGNLNRFSGRLQLSKKSVTSANKLDVIFTGDCRPAKSLF